MVAAEQYLLDLNVQVVYQQIHEMFAGVVSFLFELCCAMRHREQVSRSLSGHTPARELYLISLTDVDCVPGGPPRQP
jgi:hypothetical protein